MKTNSELFKKMFGKKVYIYFQNWTVIIDPIPLLKYSSDQK